MKFVILIAIASLIPVAAKAEHFDCIFSLPTDDLVSNILTAYDTRTERLEFGSDEAEIPEDLENVEFVIKGPGEYALSQNEEEVAHLTLDYRFSFDAGEHVYPYSARIKLLAKAKVVTGGCYSSALPLVANHPKPQPRP